MPGRFAAGPSAGRQPGGQRGGQLAAGDASRYRDDYPVLAPTGKFRPTALGLHDVSGNVSQWVNDYYESFVDAAPVTDPLGPEQGTLHVVRGRTGKPPASPSCAGVARHREWSGPALGFRVARYAEDAQ